MAGFCYEVEQAARDSRERGRREHHSKRVWQLAVDVSRACEEKNKGLERRLLLQLAVATGSNWYLRKRKRSPTAKASTVKGSPEWQALRRAHA